MEIIYKTWVNTVNGDSLTYYKLEDSLKAYRDFLEDTLYGTTADIDFFVNRAREQLEHKETVNIGFQMLGKDEVWYKIEPGTTRRDYKHIS